jgi:hypothetical protein
VDSALATQLARFVTTRGTGAIEVNAAPREVLATLPGMTEEKIQVILLHRERPLRNADELLALLSTQSRAVLVAAYPDFVRRAAFAPSQLVARVEGGVRGTALRSRATITCVPAPGRLAVVRRETE